MSWGGRADGPGDLRWHEIVQPWNPDVGGAGVAVVGFAVDEGVRRNSGRVGARDGSAALRTMLSNLPAEPDQVLIDAGDIACVGEDLEEAHRAYASRVAQLLRDGRFVIGLGGGHEIAWGSYLGLIQSGRVSPGDRIGVLNFDAHFDLRPGDVATSGTSFRFALEHAMTEGFDLDYRVIGISEAANMAGLFSTARSHGVTWVCDHDLTLLHLSARIEELMRWVSHLDVLYLTICLDVLPASVAPGVSAPAARGVSLEVLEALLAAVAGPKLLIADVAELNPAYDIDGRTARTAARLIWRLTHGR